MSKSVPCPTFRRPSYVCTVRHVGTKNTTSYTAWQNQRVLIEGSFTCLPQQLSVCWLCTVHLKYHVYNLFILEKLQRLSHFPNTEGVFDAEAVSRQIFLHMNR